MPNPSQEPPASSKALYQNLNDIEILYTFKIKAESQNFDHECIKDHWPFQNQDQDAKLKSGTSSILQSPKLGLKGHGCSLHLQNQDESQNLEHRCTKDQWPYPNQDKDNKPQSGTFCILQSPKLGLKCFDVLCKFKIKIENKNSGHQWIKDQWP